MKRRNWLLIVLVCTAAAWFILSRTVYGPPSMAVAADTPLADVGPDECDDEEGMSDAQRRYLTNQSRHWRYVMLKR